MNNEFSENVPKESYYWTLVKSFSINLARVSKLITWKSWCGVFFFLENCINDSTEATERLRLSAVSSQTAIEGEKHGSFLQLNPWKMKWFVLTIHLCFFWKPKFQSIPFNTCECPHFSGWPSLNFLMFFGCLLSTTENIDPGSICCYICVFSAHVHASQWTGNTRRRHLRT